MVVGDPPFRSVVQFYKAIGIDENKLSHLAALEKGSDSSRTKTAYKADNTMRAITASPPQDWSVKRRLDYVRWARAVVAGLRGANPRLEAEFDKAAFAAEESVRP